MDEVLALAALLEPEAFDPDVPAAPEWRERAKDTALGYAAKAITSGYRRVVVDDTTVDRLAVALHSAGCGCGMSLDDHQAAMRNDFGEEDPSFAEMAGAVRAVLEGNSQPTPSSSQPGRSEHHACCSHCTARKGSCVRCGERDAEAWELCGPCDREVEAEAAKSGRAVLGEDPDA